MIDYAVALHDANWPTMQAIQVCIDRNGWPVEFGRKGHPGWTKPLAEVPLTLGLPVVFRGEPLELEASFYTVGSNESYGNSLDVNERLASLGATHVRFNEGDRVLRLTFRVNIKEYQAGFYVMAALIKCFGGYGFGDGSHGTSGFADSLIAEATRLDSQGPAPIHVDDLKRALADIRKLAQIRNRNDPKQ